MELQILPFRATIEEYRKQAEELLAAHRAGDSQAIRFFHQHHPRFLDANIPWLPKDLPDGEIRNAAIHLPDAQLAIARWYDFQDWAALGKYVEAVRDQNSPVVKFESAVEAVIAGDEAALESSLRENPELVHARSTRITHFNPPEHRATLLHYIAANGVEGYRQKTPKNAVAIAKMLLDRGADVDALANMYGGECTPMSMLVSSCHPANAGVQVELTELLLDYGASIEGRGESKWRGPLMTALTFGYLDTAEALARRGARVAHIAAAAGLGRTAEVRAMLPAADAESRHRALAVASQHGHSDIVRMLLDAGEDPNRYNPDGHHAHSTPLHQAVAGGYIRMVRLLVERGARLDIQDTIYRGTPLGWAEYLGKTEIEKYLRGIAQ